MNHQTQHPSMSAMGSPTTPEVEEDAFADRVRSRCPDVTAIEIEEFRSLEGSHSAYAISNMIYARRRDAA